MTFLAAVVKITFLTLFMLLEQIENQSYSPISYGKAIRLSPLAVLVSVLLGAEVAGVLDALAAIPIAGSRRS